MPKFVTKLLVGTKTPSLDAFHKMLKTHEDAKGNRSHFAERLGHKINSSYETAKVAFVTNSSDETMEKLWSCHMEQKFWKAENLAYQYAQEQLQIEESIKRTPPALKIVRAALVERLETLNDLIGRTRELISDKLKDIGGDFDPDSHPSLQSFHQQGRETLDAIGLLDSAALGSLTSSSDIESFYTIAAKPIDTAILPAPTPAEDHGFFTYGMAQQRKQPGFIPPVSHEENVAASHAAYQQNDFETLPGGGVVKRRVITGPPPMLEPQVQPDGSLVLGLHKSEHQPV